MAVMVVTVALVVGAFAMVSLERRSLIAAVDSALITRSDDLTALIVGGALPDPVTVRGDDLALVQVVDGRGAVIASSANIAGEERISDLSPAPDTIALRTFAHLPIGEGAFRLAARTVAEHDRTFTIYVASSIEPANAAVAHLTSLLLVGVPLLILVVGIATWIIVGEALDPVEAIRAQVASITDRELDRRVPEPPVDDEIGRLATTMNAMLERLERASVQQRRFVADASHELRSPLTGIRAQLEVDLAHPRTARWRHTEQAVLEETVRMQRLVDDLLLLARSDARMLPRALVPVDIDDLVIDEAARIPLPDDVVLDLGAVSGAQVVGDEELLRRVVRNLLENAVRHTSGNVGVSVFEVDGHGVLRVEDDGPGVPVDERARVFERFARIDEARSRDRGGAGLGLAIVGEIVEHLNGSIVLDDSPLGGARFEVRFPVPPT